MIATTDRLVSNFSEWDFFIQYLLEFGRSGGDLKDPDIAPVLGGLWTMATDGAQSLSPTQEFVATISQGIGVSRDLDRPFLAIQAAALKIVDLTGILDGWRESLETLENEYLGAWRPAELVGL